MATDAHIPPGAFPEGDSYQRFVSRRQSRGRVWLALFMAATLVGIIALIALLLTVVNDAFGYIALQNKIDPETLVLNYHKDRMLAMPGTRNSEDDAELVAGIAPRDQAIGFFGYGVYKQAQDDLKLVSVGGQTPSAESVASGEYPLTMNSHAKNTEVVRKSGAPVELVYPKEGIVLLPFAPIILTDAPRPNVAKLFIDYVRSAAGTNAISESGVYIFFGRPGVKSPAPDLLPEWEKLKTIPMNWDVDGSEQSIKDIQKVSADVGLCK